MSPVRVNYAACSVRATATRCSISDRRRRVMSPKPLYGS
jgi:hypothetical protein